MDGPDHLTFKDCADSFLESLQTRAMSFPLEPNKLSINTMDQNHVRPLHAQHNHASSSGSSRSALRLINIANRPPATHVQAIHDFDPTRVASAAASNPMMYLRFKAGDIIRVHTRDERGWWDGEVSTADDLRIGPRRGWFPSNYVREMGLENVRFAQRAVEAENRHRIDDKTLRLLPPVVLPQRDLHTPEISPPCPSNHNPRLSRSLLSRRASYLSRHRIRISCCPSCNP